MNNMTVLLMLLSREAVARLEQEKEGSIDARAVGGVANFGSSLQTIGPIMTEETLSLRPVALRLFIPLRCMKAQGPPSPGC